MKRKEINEFQEKSLVELDKLLAQLQAALIKLKMETKTAKIKNIRAVARARDDIARIMTIMKQKELQEAV